MQPVEGRDVRNLLEKACSEVGSVLLGKSRQVQLALCCLLARGHLLIEDLPGMGKTTLAHALAAVLGLQYRRVQFTSDLMPGDILGHSVFDRDSGQFQFRPGPVFTQLLLADEINRAPPKTQSALLEAMEERQVSLEGETRALPEPFFVIATQNPQHHSGTFPLPESQLDRFLMRIELGYPDPRAERALLAGADARSQLERLGCCLSPEQLQQLQQAVAAVHLSDSVLDYLQRLIAATREQPAFSAGLSPRAALGLVRCARAWALMAGRGHVVPEDVQAVFPSVAAHRLAEGGEASRSLGAVQQLLNTVPVL